ncbi:MAG: hypothetical protein K9L75_06605 [Spirochaetia bacterium]|nr:hypothetical protein [Spirochaetia bacterium]
MRFHNRGKVDLAAFDRIIDQFPEIRSRFLGFTSTKIKRMVKSQFLSGQEIELTVDQDRLGRSMVNYGIGKRREKARLTSIPMNLFERGRKLRSEKKEPGHWVITRKAPRAAQAHVQAWANEFERLILKDYHE